MSTEGDIRHRSPLPVTVASIDAGSARRRFERIDAMRAALE